MTNFFLGNLGWHTQYFFCYNTLTNLKQNQIIHRMFSFQDTYIIFIILFQSVLSLLLPKMEHMCIQCDKILKSSDSLKMHTRHHIGSRQYACSLCVQTYVQSDHQKTHLRCQTGEKPFSCSHCGKSFPESGTMKKHKRSHTGQKPVACLLCDKSFLLSSDQRVHRRVHTWDKPFSCSQCDFFLLWDAKSTPNFSQ